MVKIFSDTSSLYKKGENDDITIIPLNVTVNSTTYSEFTDIDSKKFVELIKSGYLPKSSQPAIGNYIDEYDKCSDDEILNITVASGLSGTYSTACTAKEHSVNKDKITVFNSTTLCGPHKYLVQKAVEFSKKGLTAKEIVKKLQKALESEASFLIPSDFEYLKRGGRLSPLAAKITGKLKLFPVLKKSDDGTTLNRYSIKRGFTHAVKSICEYLKENLLSKEAIIYISHGEDIELANKTKNIVSEFFPNNTINILSLSPAFITQGGPSCVAIQVINKITV